jgi:penicillin amidase
MQFDLHEMKNVKLALALATTLALVYFFQNDWNFGSPVPAFGKFLNPFRGVWQNADGGAYADETLRIASLEAPVEVVYDSLLIPHIFAQNDRDLYRTLGYVHAQHRLWQMEFQVLATAGRLSEIVGDRALDYDRSQRRQGMVFGAKNGLAAMEQDPQIKEIIDAYTEGVNTYIAQLSEKDLPLEYKLLNYQPEPWDNLKMALFLKRMSQTLNRGDSDFENTNALNLFGKELMDVLYPDRESTDPIVDKPGGWNFAPVTLPDSLPLAVPKEWISMLPLEQPAEGVGSNNWAVAGSKTATGSPILSGDPHLELNLPSIWFVAHLNSPTVNVMGATFPGEPGVIIGFNDSIAWSPTNAQRDLVDWYRIEFKDSTLAEYRSDGAWKPAQKMVEEFKVKGKPSFFDTIVFTHHGPVVYDASFHGDSEKKHYAMRWISHDGSNEMRAFYELNRARNHAEYMKALDHYVAPAQNWAFACVNGDIAIRIQGKFPVRRVNEGRFVLDGTTTATEWQAFIPYEQNVMDKNPPRGFISSANQISADATYPYYLHTGSYNETYRNRRINQLLTQASNITPQDMMKMQNDNFNLQAAESVPLLLAKVDAATLSAEAKTIYEELAKWNFFNEADLVAPAYYEVLWEEVLRGIWDEMFESKVRVRIPTDFTTIQLMKDNPELSFYDVVATGEKETLPDVIKIAFEKTASRIGTWKNENAGKVLDWGNYKNTLLQHLMRLLPMSEYARNGGNGGIVNATSHRHGPSWRMIVSLEKTGVRAWGTYPGGQSGNPASPFYTNLIDSWERAQPNPLHFTTAAAALKPAALFTVQFQPEAK